MKKKYTEQEIKYIKNNYKTKTIREMSLILNRSMCAIQTVMHRKKFKKGIICRSITLKHKDGRIVSYPSISQFAREHNLSKFHVSRILFNGQLPQKCVFYHGWYDSTPLLKPIVIRDDDNVTHVVNNVAEFSLKNNIKLRALMRILKRKTKYHSGFRLYNTPKPPPKRIFNAFEYVFCSPDGLKYTTNNLSQFSKKMGLSYNGLWNTIKQRRNSYKKWRFVRAKKVKF